MTESSHAARVPDDVVPFQFGYVTSDLDRAMTEYGAHFGGGDFLQFDRTLDVLTPDGPAQARLRVALAWVSPAMTVEFIEPVEGATAIYDPLVDPSGAYSTALHHIGYRVRGDYDRYRGLRASYADAPVLLEKQDDPNSGWFYVDLRPEVGHFLEYLWWSDDAAGFLDTLPGPR